MQPNLIDTTTALVTFLDGLGECKGQPPSLYIDLEGNDLSRQGTLSLVTILVEPQQKLHLIDVTTLKGQAFDTCGSDSRALKDILESKEIIKVFFDIRNDSDALFSLYGVRVDGIEDLQLMELATRNFSKRCVNGLAKCIERDATIPYPEKRDWQKVKDNGRKLFDPARGGSFAIFDQRPMSQELFEYCAQDVTLMPNLREVYCKKLCDAWWRKIGSETVARIALSHQPSYNGKGRHMALGPTSWPGWSPAPAERGVRTLFEVSRPSQETADAPSTSVEADPAPSSRPQTVPDAIIWTTRQHARAASETDSDSDNEDLRFSSYGRFSDDESNGVGDDFTACDKDDCGYCGRCPY